MFYNKNGHSPYVFAFKANPQKNTVRKVICPAEVADEKFCQLCRLVKLIRCAQACSFSMIQIGFAPNKWYKVSIPFCNINCSAMLKVKLRFDNALRMHFIALHIPLLCFDVQTPPSFHLPAFLKLCIESHIRRGGQCTMFLILAFNFIWIRGKFRGCHSHIYPCGMKKSPSRDGKWY